MVAKSASKDRLFEVKTQDVDRSEIESLPSPPRRRSRGRTQPNPPSIDDEEYSVSTSSALSIGATFGATESKTKVKVRLRRFFSRKSPNSPKQLPLPTTFDILEDLSFTEEAISRSSSRISRKSSLGKSHSSEDSGSKVVSGTRSKTIVDNSQSTDDNDAVLDKQIDNILEHREDGSMTSMESDANAEIYAIAKGLHSPNSWSDQVKDARRYYPSSPLSLAEAEAERRALLTPVQESVKSEDEESETNATGFTFTRTGNDLPGDNAWKSEMANYRNENLEERLDGEESNLRDDSLRDDVPMSEYPHLVEEYPEGILSRNEDPLESLSINERYDLHGTCSGVTYQTTETTLLTVEQLKRDLELFSLENVAERMLPNMQCQKSDTNRNHSNVHKTDHVFPSKPWCYAPEQEELFHEARSEASAAPTSDDRMFGCVPLPELYTSSSPVTSPTHHGDLQFVQVAYGHHPGMNIMSDITSFEISQASTGSSSFSEDSTMADQSNIGLDAAASGQTTFTEDSESLSVQTDDDLSHTEDELSHTDDDDDDSTQTEDDSDSSVSTASAPKAGHFRSWMGSPVIVISNSDSDSDSSSTVRAPSKETKDPSLFKWLHGN
jgi:hypothetical protein